MIKQTEMKKWIPEAVEYFKSKMPPIDAPYPEIYIASSKTEGTLRMKLMEITQSIINRYGIPSMEQLHGDGGDAIIIYQKRFTGRKWEENAKEKFQHMLWHQLGHFYAMNAENPDDNLRRFLDETFDDDEIEMHSGYIFWSEFIAEVIACKISPDPVVDWDSEYLFEIRWEYECQLQSMVIEENDSESIHSLAIYYATILANKKILAFRKAVSDGKIYRDKSGKLSEGIDDKKGVLLTEEDLDSYQFKPIPDVYLSTIKLLRDRLERHLKEDNYWIVTPSELDAFGAPIELILKIRKAGYTQLSIPY